MRIHTAGYWFVPVCLEFDDESPVVLRSIPQKNSPGAIAVLKRHNTERVRRLESADEAILSPISPLREREDAGCMGAILYYVMTLLESVLGVFGVRALYEQPPYAVVRRLESGVEIRRYEGRVAVETDARGQGDGEAFGRLFRYITGANRSGDRIAMTAPVEAGGRRIAMTVPVEQGEGGTMRFFLPKEVAEAGAPEPTEPGVRVVTIPPETIAALRFSGRMTPDNRREEEARLLAALKAARLAADGPPFFMGYDPPFAIPFLRRNEVAVRLAPSAS